MRITEKYYYFITASVFFICAISIVLVWHFRAQLLSHTQKHVSSQVKNTPLDVPSTVPSQIGKLLTFTDKTIHIAFSYPDNLEVEKLSNQLVAISNGKEKGENDVEFVYIAPATKKNAEVIAPFKVDGQISQTVKIHVSNFNARLVTFKKGSETSQLFFLRSNTRVIIIRPPRSSAIDPETVYGIVQSIHELM